MKSFRDSDVSETFVISKLIKAGDILIRDLGYFKLKFFNQIIDKKANFLSRLKYGVHITDIITKEKIDLPKYLAKHGGMDVVVQLGKKETLECRLIAVPIPEKVANERRRKARKNRDLRVDYTQEYYDLLGYVIYITNVKQDVWTANEVSKAYRSRWFIEILFKSWKSNLKMKMHIPERYNTKQRVEFFFYTTLLLVNLVIMPLFIIASHLSLNHNKYISIMKLCSFVKQQLYSIITLKKLDETIRVIQYHCQYEKRKNRINVIENTLNSIP